MYSKRVTPAGRRALNEWLAAPTDEWTELRDPGLLQLFLGADPQALAEVQLRTHRAKLAEYEELHRTSDFGGLPGPRLALEAGLAHEREWVRFWERLADG
ncbi:MAG TPA: hypothetical protein VNB64_00590 [Solirubrobacteraceae bacterium]|nr:hypothetical protein [Solirubrobacteraceae bacterium]